MQFCMFMFKGCSFTVMVWMAITPKWPATELLSTNRHPFFSLPQLLVFKPWEEYMDVCACVFRVVALKGNLKKDLTSEGSRTENGHSHMLLLNNTFRHVLSPLESVMLRSVTKPTASHWIRMPGPQTAVPFFQFAWETPG